MTYRFTIPHSLPERTRIRWAGDASEREVILDLAARIESLSGVMRSKPRLATGSIVIEHDGVEWKTLENQLNRQLEIVFQPLDQAMGRTGLETFNDGVNRFDSRLKKINLDLDSMSFLFLVLMAVSQALRGRVGVSSVSFMWYALTLAARARQASPASLADRLKQI